MPLFDPYQDQTASLQLPQMPVTPAPKKGLFSSIGNLLAKADTVDDNGLTFWDRLGNVSASLRDDPAYRQMAYEQNAAKSQAYKKDALQKQALEQANAQADGLGLTGRERLLFMISPDKWAEDQKTRVLGAGDAIISPFGAKPIYNTRTFTAGDQIFNTTLGGAPEQVGTVDPTFADQTARINATRPEYRSVGAGDQLLEIPNPNATQGYTPSGVLPPADAVAPLLTQAIPGLRITGLGRDPSRNAQVGGVANSMHLDNHAIDMVLPPNVKPDQVVAMLRQQGIEPTEVLNEGQVGGQGAHLHVGWRPKSQQAAQSSGPRVIAQGAPKATVRPATAAEKAAYGIPADVPAQMKPDGSVDVISGLGAGNKAVPAAVAGGYVQNRTGLSKIDNAIKLVEQFKTAFGAKNVFGDDIMQRIDPQGVAARAAVADIAGQVMHDRSGAAVTVGEEKRLKPYIPNPTDRPETILTKLKGLRQQYANNNAEIEAVYGEDNGYRPLGGGQQSQRQSTNSALKAKSSGKEQFIVGQVYTDPQGIDAKYLGNGEWEEQ